MVLVMDLRYRDGVAMATVRVLCGLVWSYAPVTAIQRCNVIALSHSSLKLGGPVEPQGLLSQRPSPKFTTKAPARDRSPRLNPAAQPSQAQSGNQDTVTSGGPGAPPSPAQTAKPVLQRRRNSNTLIQPECQGPRQAQLEPAARPHRETPSQRAPTSLGPEQHPSLVEEQAREEKTQAHPQLNKSQSLSSAFGLRDTPFFRTASEDVANTETIRNLRKSFASLFSK